MSELKPSFYLCTGFHRSGTSLLAQSLAAGGMYMGQELMGATFSNPLGHVEDMPVVRLHDKLFKINGTDWRYRDNTPLIKPEWLTNYIKRYLDESMQESAFCGVKDPRAAFFLDDWYRASEGRLACVLVYRHWSTAIHSIFNRASRHLINGVAPIPSNRLNYSFWQQPNLAADMWIATNKRIIEFYRKHPSRCILLSQEAFINSNLDVQGVAHKIGLAPDCLANQSFDQTLLTHHAPSMLKSMYSNDKLRELESVWGELQELADVATSCEPRFLAEEGGPTARQLGVDCVTRTVSIETESCQFDLSQLTWQEALGFLASVPEHLFGRVQAESLLQRSYTNSNHCDTLAKICHKNHLYLYTKLAKMRAMQVAAGSWKVAQWKLYVEDELHWLHQPDAELLQSVPFSLRPCEDLEAYEGQLDLTLVHADWLRITKVLEQPAYEHCYELLNLLLLYRKNLGTEHYQYLANYSLHKGFLLISEFAFIKLLRLSYTSENMISLGDLYLKLEMPIKALNCYEEADELMPNTAAVLARLANAQLLLGDVHQAKRYFAKAQVLQPNNRVVKLCQSKLSNLNIDSEIGDLNTDAVLTDMLVMPTVASYEEVVTLTNTDEKAGVLLDRYAQSTAFLLRNNRQWLIRGMRGLSSASANYLAFLVYHHWKKLWGGALLDTLLFLPKRKSVPRKVARFSSQYKTAIYIELDASSEIDVLEAFIDNIHCELDWVILGPKSVQAEAVAFANRYSNNVKFYRCSEDNIGFDFQQQKLTEYDLVCRLHLKDVTPHTQAQNSNLQQLFSLLGSADLVGDIVSSLLNQDNLGMVVPSYHPALVNELACEPHLTALAQKASAVGLTIDSTFYVYPFGGMYWYCPKLLSESHQELLSTLDICASHELLPAALLANSSVTKLSHML